MHVRMYVCKGDARFDLNIRGTGPPAPPLDPHLASYSSSLSNACQAG